MPAIEAENVIVKNGVLLPDGSWERDAGGNFLRNPALVDADTKAIVDKYRVAIAPIANRIVGQITDSITRVADRSRGERSRRCHCRRASRAYAVGRGTDCLHES